jgi:hypothetical protein
LKLLSVTLRPAQLILLYNLTLFNGHLSNAANGHLFHAWIVRSSSNNDHFGHLINMWWYCVHLCYVYTCVCTHDGIVYIFVMYTHVSVHMMVLCTSLLCIHMCVHVMVLCTSLLWCTQYHHMYTHMCKYITKMYTIPSHVRTNVYK